ncbi:uncharacterized protein [Aristolochia californica]|uniref:uncharacterized protein n=1 Tax=Aristolochia californica TaxID=171875 RepID=UPI0035DE3F6C
MKSVFEQASPPMASPAPENNPNVYTIGGIPVEFPYKPYGTQLAFMGRVIATLDKAQRQGRCHALLESPTGTGKSLSLLCSTLAWQKHFSLKPLVPNTNGQSVGPDASLDPLAFGGGFIPEPDSMDNSLLGSSRCSSQATNNKKEKKPTVPRIYYSTRTHGQISQVIREYRKTSYHGPMSVLASRKHYCTNRHVCGKEKIDEECKNLLTDENMGCPEFKNVHRIRSHPSFQKGGYNEVHDIEDLVKIGHAVRGCSYFAARSMAEEAPLVFCPYNYIINPTIRKAMEVDLQGAIVILDEAHNVEDIARDAGSLDVEEELLDELQSELGQLCLIESQIMVYQPLYDMIQGIISWIGQKKNNLERREFEHYFSCWTGNEALAELHEAGVTRECFPILQECAVKAIKAASDTDLDGVHLSGRSAVLLEGLFSSLSYFFSENGAHACDYRLALQKYMKRDASCATQKLTVSLNLWLLNPAVVFKEIAGLSLSIILTSGTLSPVDSFASELGVQFETCMEAPHVIDVESQLWAAVISSGPGNYRLNASYKTADGFDFQDTLGASLEEICKIVPGGALVFFPSYKLLEKLQSRWIQTGQWSRLNAQKSLFVEPRGNHEDFESVLKCYYNSIHGNTRSVCRETAKSKPKKSDKQDMEQLSTKDHSPKHTQKAAAFLAVCRGKVSEGIDFSDDNARVVVVVGIPFPNINDIQVVLKKKYNDKYKMTRNLLSGSQWYCYQAFRALNQAIGRCIRHRLDYGAIILLDERFKEENTAYISKWLRKSIKRYDNFDMSMEGLRKFFKAKEHLSQNDPKVGVIIKMEDSHIDREPLNKKGHCNKTSRTCGRKRNKCNVNGDEEVKITYESNIAAVKSRKLAQFLVAVKKDRTSVEDNAQNSSIGAEEKNIGECSQRVDLNCSAQIDTRSLETASAAYFESSSDESIVKESSRFLSMNEATSTVVEGCNELSAQQCCPSLSHANLSGLSERSCSLATPEREANFSVCSSELEPSFARSVNSHSSKRRLPISFQMCIHSQTDPSTFSETNCSNQDVNFQIGLDPEICHMRSRVPRPDMPKNASNDLIYLDMDKKLHLSCFSCNNPLGLPENNFFIMCSLGLSSKDYLVSVYKNGSVGAHLQNLLFVSEPLNVSVVIADISFVNNAFTARTGNGPLPGVWCEEDGCVFRTFPCCFCTKSGCDLGMQVLATDASNTHLMNKVILYVDRVLIKDHEDESKEKPLVAASGSNSTQVLYSKSFQKDSCSKQPNNLFSCGSTKSKLRLPKRLSTTGRCITEQKCGTSDTLQ